MKSIGRKPTTTSAVPSPETISIFATKIPWRTLLRRAQRHAAPPIFKTLFVDLDQNPPQ
jgi:hypothetical protein